MIRVILCVFCVLVTVNTLKFMHGRKLRVRTMRKPKVPIARILYGIVDTTGKYPYIVALVSQYRRECTGALITPEWVLTAAHCIFPECPSTHIQYSDMVVFPNDTEMKREIVDIVKYPGYQPKRLIADIALLRVGRVSKKRYGKLSSVDHQSLVGLSVEYAGFGTTEHANVDDERRPLLIGEGVVTSCSEIEGIECYSLVCVTPKCSNKQQDTGGGDSGGPLFHDNKIFGIVSYGYPPYGMYTAVSPHITWIQKVTSQINNNSYNNRLRV